MYGGCSGPSRPGPRVGDGLPCPGGATWQGLGEGRMAQQDRRLTAAGSEPTSGGEGPRAAPSGGGYQEYPFDRLESRSNQERKRKKWGHPWRGGKPVSSKAIPKRRRGSRGTEEGRRRPTA
ncbi:hypothetical protein E2562_016118 [Oryza meyeriana var. granulata]|uniref:Uncharacterized protein n=1 Tax=Oryza meyeriana var. granulata TaxID=110450 RepID=A0A6G1BL55_9ORYZ|nr:hypothetical protein E2562_016118 [Oryza meyeriana var. granulata]